MHRSRLFVLTRREGAEPQVQSRTNARRAKMEDHAAAELLRSRAEGSDRPPDKESLNPALTVEQETQFTCSLYISRAGGGPQDPARSRVGQGCELLRSRLEEAIAAAAPFSAWRVTETPCGLIAAFARENDAEKLLQRDDLGQVFGTPVQVARFSAKDSRYPGQAVLLRGVPWAIPLQDIDSALTKQGIVVGNVERARQFVRVEVLDAGHYEALLRRGLDFFGAARFNAVPERWWRGSNSTGCPSIPSQCVLRQDCNTSATSDDGGQVADGVLQCYRCQGFWHVAANCRHLPRCVRCGEPHSVEFCPRPRNNPVCCHCSGAHHAGYKQCPVRLQLSNATPVSITLNTAHTGGQYPASAVNKSNHPRWDNSLRQGHC
ncbi:uncharacterized protein LOC105187862 isoform X2 [Harpegnathos saltator]|uniref:uncharacterized protein LOC105187862 isoform X2 n=1 Tax=Harpegnathos saltator TaxID=610380 RepID=UPI000DBED8ED|nr:uncharacterized protein LOC105187862 isoform X2 [Harpegnathos saltator]